jgi:hypothetical protein
MRPCLGWSLILSVNMQTMLGGIDLEVARTYTDRTYDLTLGAGADLFQKFAARDQAVRVVQYTARGLRGLLSALGFTPQDSAYRKASNVFLRTASSRRTFRWLSFYPSFLQVWNVLNGSEAWGWGTEAHKKVLFLTSRLTLILFEFFDKCLWLAETNTVFSRTRKKKWLDLGFGLLAVACGLTAIHHAEEAYFKQSNGKEKRAESRKNMYKFVMNMFANAHVSGLYKTHDILCGIFGSLSSTMALLDMYPMKKTGGGGGKRLGRK